MINWRNGKGGFVGGLKRLIKGVFQFAHTINSADPQPPTPDCYVSFIGAITESTLSDAAFIGTITDSSGFIGTLDAADAGFSGTITDTNGYQGDICHD